jgi:hypothetical protein
MPLFDISSPTLRLRQIVNCLQGTRTSGAISIDYAYLSASQLESAPHVRMKRFHAVSPLHFESALTQFLVLQHAGCQRPDPGL